MNKKVLWVPKFVTSQKPTLYLGWYRLNFLWSPYG